MEPSGPQRMLMGRKFLSPDTRKSWAWPARNGRAVAAQRTPLNETAVNAPQDQAAAIFAGDGPPLQDEHPGGGPAALLVVGVVADPVEHPVGVGVEAGGRLP